MRPPKGISVRKHYKIRIRSYHWFAGPGEATVYRSGRDLKRMYEDGVSIIRYEEYEPS